jgi:hypothetical protein
MTGGFVLVDGIKDLGGPLIDGNKVELVGPKVQSTTKVGDPKLGVENDDGE